MANISMWNRQTDWEIDRKATSMINNLIYQTYFQKNENILKSKIHNKSKEKQLKDMKKRESE